MATNAWTPSDILLWASDQMRTLGAAGTCNTIDGKLYESPYRLELSDEPESAPDGLYFVEFTDIEPRAPSTGAPETRNRGHFSVRVSYFRGGGAAAAAGTAGLRTSGDKRSRNASAAEDMQRIMDFLGEPGNYTSDSSGGLNIVTPIGATRAFTGRARDVWEARFFVEWQSTLMTSTST